MQRNTKKLSCKPSTHCKLKIMAAIHKLLNALLYFTWSRIPSHEERFFVGRNIVLHCTSVHRKSMLSPHHLMTHITRDNIKAPTRQLAMRPAAQSRHNGRTVTICSKRSKSGFRVPSIHVSPIRLHAPSPRCSWGPVRMGRVRLWFKWMARLGIGAPSVEWAARELQAPNDSAPSRAPPIPPRSPQLCVPSVVQLRAPSSEPSATKPAPGSETGATHATPGPQLGAACHMCHRDERSSALSCCPDL